MLAMCLILDFGVGVINHYLETSSVLEDAS